MSLREDLEEVFAKRIVTDPTWRKLADTPPDSRVQLSGPIEQTLQAVIDAQTAYSDALLETVLTLADIVDDLRNRVTV